MAQLHLRTLLTLNCQPFTALLEQMAAIVTLHLK